MPSLLKIETPHNSVPLTTDCRKPTASRYGYSTRSGRSRGPGQADRYDSQQQSTPHHDSGAEVPQQHTPGAPGALPALANSQHTAPAQRYGTEALQPLESAIEGAQCDQAFN